MTVTQTPPSGSTQPEWAPKPDRPVWKKKRVLVPAGLLAAFVSLGIVGSALGPTDTTQVSKASATSNSADAQAQADRLAAEKASADAAADRAAAEKIAAEADAARAAAEKLAAETAAAEQKAAADKVAADKVAADKAAQQKAAADKAATAKAVTPAEATVSFTMPNFKGTNLQAAQDAVQTHGVFYSVSHDLLATRMQVLDANWKVCNQTPAAGSAISGPAADWEGRIDFGVVNLTESCP
jgi:flagellar biosynthesis GTPase FlhF